MSNRYIITEYSTMDAPLASVGGKAANLINLHNQHFPVPIFFCITTAAFCDWLSQKRVSEIVKGVQSTRNFDKPISIQKELENIGLPDAITNEIFLTFDRVFSANDYVSVRSSALGEDSGSDSFAGQLSTFLHVQREQLIDRISQCFSSAFSSRAIAYRQERNISLNGISSAVVIQKMVASEKSGVLFTSDPISGDRDKIVITSGYGLGEGIVSDLVEADTYYVNKKPLGIADKTIVKKTKRVLINTSSGYDTEICSVKSSAQEEPSLNEREVLDLSKMALKVEASYKKPQDIEWAFDTDGKLFLLQTRPITTLICGQKRIFDNANIVEGYPGVTTPLTFSIARMGYEIVFRNSAKAMGASKANLDKNRAKLENMVGFIQGRVYYQISNWYAFYRMVPGMSKNIANWEKSLGLPATNLKEDNPTGIFGAISSLRLTAALLYQLLTINQRIALFHKLFRKTQADFKKVDLQNIEPDEALDIFDKLTSEVLNKWECTTINDFFVFKFFSLLEVLIERYGLSSRKNIINELLASQPDMESVAPVKSALNISTKIRENQDLHELFLNTQNDDVIWKEIQSNKSFSDIQQKIADHIDTYGDRTVQELKLEVPSIADDPSFLIRILKSYVISQRSFDTMEDHMEDMVKGAEQYVSDRLHKFPIKHRIFDYVLNRCRKAIAERENMRFSRTRAFGIIKQIFQQIAQKWSEQGVIDNKEDIFFLSYEEITSYIRGSSVNLNLKSLILQRRKDYDENLKCNPAPRVTTYGTVYANRLSQTLQPALNSSSALKGTGCSPGKLTAPARVIKDPLNAGDINGCILVAEMTDPGWVFLMVAAEGLIVERGNILSHTAIIGRELGIPTVIGVENATQLIEDGDIITIDGEQGHIVINDNINDNVP